MWSETAMYLLASNNTTSIEENSHFTMAVEDTKGVSSLTIDPIQRFIEKIKNIISILVVTSSGVVIIKQILNILGIYL